MGGAAGAAGPGSRQKRWTSEETPHMPTQGQGPGSFYCLHRRLELCMQAITIGGRSLSAVGSDLRRPCFPRRCTCCCRCSGPHYDLGHRYCILLCKFMCVVAASAPAREKSSSQSPRSEGIGIGPAHATSKLSTKTSRGVPQSGVQELSYHLTVNCTRRAVARFCYAG